ncbi:MAG TPA: penicillin acylase family protein, partial [Polyangiaceae bacterium]|nr:penicillin acylase family protein [Polyangiaceae bacterium]
MRWRHLAWVFVLGSLVTAVDVACTSGGDNPPVAPGPFGATPAVTGTQNIDHLTGPVDVLRDHHGMVHIYAISLTDAVRVEGYQLARDRTAQLELIRRTAEGKIAELLGNANPSLIDQDILARTIGLQRVAQQMYETLDANSEEKAVLDAYADGVSQFNARLQLPASDPKHESLPSSMVGLPAAAFGPWTGVDVLAVGRLQAEGLSFTASDEISQSEFVQAAGAAFPSTATDDLGKERAKLLLDLIRFEPLDTTQVLPGFPNDGQHTSSLPFAPAARVPAVRAPAPSSALGVYAGVRGFLEAEHRQRAMLGDHGITGSNNWAVGPSRTATGHAMLASDPHLSLSAPAVFYMVQLNVVVDTQDPSKNLDATGLAFPGVPGIILGFNDHVAWGATTANYDVTDVYQETLTADGSGVVFNGNGVPFQKIHETIN